MRFVRHCAVAAALLLGSISVASADNQTTDLSPIQMGGLPYNIGVQAYDFGSADLPTLQSFAAGEYDGKWVLIAGRTNGLHGFTNSGAEFSSLGTKR